MVKNIWQDIEKQLNSIKDILDKSLYNKKKEGSLSDSELTELIMMRGYLHNLKNNDRELDAEKIKTIASRFKEIEQNLR